MDIFSDIIVALITGGITLLGVVSNNNKKQAILETKLEALTKSVEKHNGFGERIPKVENDIQHIYHEIDEITRKLP